MTKHLCRLIVAGLAVTALSGCRDNVDKSAPAKVDLATQGFSQQWAATLDLQGDTISEIYLRDKSVFAYSKKHRVFIVDRASGTIQNIYTVAATAGTLYPPVLLNEGIVYPTNERLEVMDYKGKFVRTIHPGAAIRSPATGSPKALYLGADFTYGGRLLAIDLAHEYKPVRWELMTFGGISAAPAVFQGVVFCGSEDGRVYAVSEERSAVWPIEGGVFVTNGRIIADLKADDFGVYVASTDSKLYCLARGNGKIRWQYFAGKPLIDSPSVTADYVFQTVRGQGIVALLKTEGPYNRSPKWSVADAVKYLAEDDKYVYLSHQDGSVVGVDKNTGEQKFASQAKFTAFANNMKDGIIYAMTPNGELIAAKPTLRAGTGGQVVLELQPTNPVASAR